jgi:hypothetical protein
MLRQRIRLIPTLIALGVIGLVGWCALPSAQLDPDCSAEPNLRVRVGDQPFAVPRGYVPSIYVQAASGLKLMPHPICQRPDDPPIEAKAFLIDPGRQPYFAKDARTRPIWRVQLEVRDRQLPHRKPPDTYAEALRYIESAGQGVRLNDLPRKQGVIAHDRLEQGRHTYIALPGTIGSLDDAPIVIECTGPPLRSPAGTYFGRPCRTSYYTFSDAIVIRYKFYDGRYPVSTWKGLDARVRGFVRSLQVDF